MKMNKKLIPYVLMASLTVGGLNAIKYEELLDTKKTSGIDLRKKIEVLSDQQDNDKGKAARGEVSLKDARVLYGILGADAANVTDTDSAQKATAEKMARLLDAHIKEVEALIKDNFANQKLVSFATECNAFNFVKDIKATMNKELAGPGVVKDWLTWAYDKAWTERTWTEYTAYLAYAYGVYAAVKQLGLMSHVGPALEGIASRGRVAKTYVPNGVTFFPEPVKKGWFGRGSK